MSRDIWKHGKYFDLWSVVHFLSGFLLASASQYLNLTLVNAFVFALILLIAWEFCELMLKIIEPSPNVVTDILVGLVGFFIGLVFDYGWGVPVLVVTLLLTAWGFIDFVKHGYH